MVVKAISSLEEFSEWEKNSAADVQVLVFGSTWHPPTQQMHTLLDRLAEELKTVDFWKVDADACIKVMKFYKCEAIPVTLIFVDGKHVETIKGANPPILFSRCQHYATMPKSEKAKENHAQSPTAKREVNDDYLKELINSAPVMVFMKGDRSAPFCKFSKELVKIFTEHQLEYSAFNIFLDNDVREKLKVYSDWPTYPQVYVKGEFLGGIDVIRELIESGDFVSQFPAGTVGVQEVKPATVCPAPVVPSVDINARLHMLIHQAPVMLFMKGTPSQPECGFSQQIVSLFKREEIPFESFNILSDNQVREELKKYSDWPTYPQVYAKGELIGGLDIIKELHESGELKKDLNLE
eukprot:Platyproteum_vivax@DN5438_c0_g1_i1.p1